MTTADQLPRDAGERAMMLAGASNEDVANLAEVAAERGRMLRTDLAHWKAVRDDCLAQLENRLGEGEAVVASYTGRVAFLGKVSDQPDTTNEAALTEVAEKLPEQLRPKVVTQLPSPAELRKAKKTLAEAGINVWSLITRGTKKPGIRWRTLDTD